MKLPDTSRRTFLRYLSLSGLGAFITSCLSSNAPTAASPGAGGGVGQPAAAVTQLLNVTLEFRNCSCAVLTAQPMPDPCSHEEQNHACGN